MTPHNSRAGPNSQELAAMSCGIWEELYFHIMTDRQILAAYATFYL